MANRDFKLESKIEFEEKFTADSGNSIIVPINKNWKSLGIHLSGGLDSALLLYLTNLTISKHNLDIKIKPISVFIPTKAKNIVSISNIIDKIRQLTGTNNICDALIYNMPMEETSYVNGKKSQYFKNITTALLSEKKIDYVFNGDTKNPPEHIRTHFVNNNDGRQTNRDNPISIYKHYTSASPNAFVDKKDIINLYLKFNIFNEISPLTISCDSNIDKIHRLKLSVPCGRCWWCYERKYGHESNNVTDLAPIISYDEYTKK